MSISASDAKPEFRRLLSEVCPELTASQVCTLAGHYELLSTWNKRLNLTRIESVEEAVQLHYFEGVFLARQLPAGALRIVDVGSGAGFPGIPVAVVRPDCEVTLVESHQRKAVFLREATRDSSNVKVVASRAEDLVARYDWVISRAVRPADVLKLNLADRAALLVGADDARDASTIRMPGSLNRVVAIVPRGTLG